MIYYCFDLWPYLVTLKRVALEILRNFYFMLNLYYISRPVKFTEIIINLWKSYIVHLKVSIL